MANPAYQNHDAYGGWRTRKKCVKRSMAALLEIRDLQTSFFTSDGEVRAVN
jgi:hypothetical protein